MSKQLLPIMTANGSFENLRRGGYVYVDKTAYLHSLVRQEGNMFFLSRPRRFGKTLTVSTLEAIFQGKRELFKGLAIDALDYDWKIYPVIHIDFGDCPENTPQGLDGWLARRVRKVAEAYGVTGIPETVKSAEQFSGLIEKLAVRGGVVILVDEYDKVLSDNVFSEKVEELRTVLGNFYQVMKTKGDLLRFVFITGVTKFSKVGIFSGMNNLKDRSMSPVYATMMGYTQKELESCFASYIKHGIRKSGLDRDAYLARVKEMYDGYRFAPGAETVYNPVSIGNFFDPEDAEGTRFKGYWAETGNMKLVMDMASTIDLDVTEVLSRGMSESAFDSFDIAELKSMKGDANKIQALLLQTGYLTLDHEDEVKGLYYLRMPNREVRDAYDKSLLRRFGGGGQVDQEVGDMCDALKAGETEKFISILSPFMSGITYPEGASREVVFATVIATLMRQMRHQLTATSEERTSGGRIDLSIVTDKHVYVIEYKVDKDAEAALSQIKDKHYADKFRLEEGKRVHLVGISFSSTDHALLDWKEEVLD